MNVPIIGQPQVNDWFLSIQVTCPCKHTFMLVGQVGAMRQCACGKIYRLQGWPIPTPEGQLNVPLGYAIQRGGDDGPAV